MLDSAPGPVVALLDDFFSDLLGIDLLSGLLELLLHFRQMREDDQGVGVPRVQLDPDVLLLQGLSAPPLFGLFLALGGCFRFVIG